MLGFERKEPFVVKGKYAEELRAMLERMRTGNYNEEDLERIHFQNVTPEYELVDGDNKMISNFCEVCDLHRNNSCSGAHHSCEKFVNRWDEETCGNCKFAEPIEDDKRHIFCSKKNEKRHIDRWCINQEKKK